MGKHIVIIALGSIILLACAWFNGYNSCEKEINTQECIYKMVCCVDCHDKSELRGISKLSIPKISPPKGLRYDGEVE